MNKNDTNFLLVNRIALALGELREELVFVGGCATGLLITDQARPPVRATTDVDLVAEVASKADYYSLVKRLKQAGFKEDSDIVCRWRYKEAVVDVMPTEEEILGFSNRWYVEAVKQATLVRLDETSIRLVTAPLLIATKLEAYYGRGNNDPGSSHDIEDILTLIDGRPELLAEIPKAGLEIQDYLKNEVDDLLSQSHFLDTLPWHFGPADQARVSLVIERLRKIAGL